MKLLSKFVFAKKIFLLLTVNERSSTVFLIFLMFVGMVLETLGIGMVLPAIAMMTQGQNSISLPYEENLLIFIGNPGQEDLVILGVVVLSGLYFIKAIFLSFLAWKQTKFAFNIQASLSLRLYSSYLSQPYSFHLKRNSAELIRNTINEVNLFTFNVILPLLMLLTELFVLIGLVILLLIIEPIGTMVVILLIGSVAVFFYIITRNRISDWGEQRQKNEGLRIQQVQQGLGGIKDVILMDKIDFFLEQYSLHNKITAKVGEKQKTLAQFPRIWLELVAVLGLMSLVIVMLLGGRDVKDIVPMVGLFAAAAFRLLPSVTRILSSIQSIRYGLSVVFVLYDELNIHSIKKVEFARNNSIKFNSTFLVDAVSFIYEGVHIPSLSDVSLVINKGETVGIIGSSGAGKSTLIDIILGLLMPSSGGLIVDGNFVLPDNISLWQKKIGYVPQSIFLMDDTLRKNIAIGIASEDIDEELINKAIVDAQLLNFINELPDGLDTKVGERGVRLSGGQIQRIGICRALYNDPEILVLDEASSALDTTTENGIMDAINNMHGEKTIIIVAHRLSTVQNCDRIYKLCSGKIVAEGTPAEILI